MSEIKKGDIIIYKGKRYPVLAIDCGGQVLEIDQGGRSPSVIFSDRVTLLHATAHPSEPSSFGKSAESGTT